MALARTVLWAAVLVGLCGWPARAQPGAVEAAARPGYVRVFWTPAAGAAAHVILRDGQEIGRADARATEFRDDSAVPGRTYRYSVAAVDSSGRLREGIPYLERAWEPLPGETRCDVLVVGANAAGVSAAVVAARYGLRTVLTEETRRLGGMAANGLGASDIRRLEHASGFFEEFRRRVQRLYGAGNGLRYEPRIAQQVIKEMVWTAPGLTVHRGLRPVAVGRRGRTIAWVETETVPQGRRARFVPRIVVDATECGDVAAWAGCRFRVGREPRTAREPHAGVIYYDRSSDSLMPGSTGEGDRRLQAYSYLMTVKDHGQGTDHAIPPPPGYDPAKYWGAPRWRDSWNATSGRLPNDKYEINQHPHGSDLQGTNYGYPAASYAQRRRIEEEFRNHALGYLHYMQTVQGMRSLALSEDDYRDSDGWPSLLYIREARRFQAGRVIDETDIMNARDVARPNAIGIGDYAMDSHATQPAPDFDHYAPGPKHMGEGEFYLPQYTPWHQVPHDIMIPRGVDNLFTPTAVSATHVAYGTYRMEPVRMQFGTAAGVLSYLALRSGLRPRDVPARPLQLEILKAHAGTADRPALEGAAAPGPCGNPALLYKFSDVTPETRHYAAIQWLGSRGFWPAPRPARRTPSSGLEAAPFRPDSALTVGEARRLMGLLEKRRADSEGWERTRGGLAFEPEHSAPRPQRVADSGDDPWWPDSGRTAGDSAEALSSALPPGGSGQRRIAALEARAGSDSDAGQLVSRAGAVRLIAEFCGWDAPRGEARYADLIAGSLESAAAEALAARWIDSRLWDGPDAFAPDGRLLFRPLRPITRAQFAHLLFLAHMHFGPLWEDHPPDRGDIGVRQ